MMEIFIPLGVWVVYRFISGVLGVEGMLVLETNCFSN